MLFIKSLLNIQLYLLAIEWVDIRNFLLGMGTGFVLLALFVAFILITGRKRQSKIYKSKEKTLNDTAIQELIEFKQNQLIETARIADNAYFRVAFELSMELMTDIAKYYFKDSKYPMYELSIQELLDLNYYITKRLTKLINGKFIRRFKNYRISTIVNLLNKKKALDNSKIMKLNRQYKVSKILSIGAAVLNYANPIYWFRKIAIKPSTTLVTKEACKLIIRIVGEETNNLYSKKMFETPTDETVVEHEFDKAVEEAEILESQEGGDADVIQTKKSR
ncbi:MAG: hypothetical protein CVV56_07570 [Tenericutes bacterium HGW-Tenericutes-1]|jgi:hypothetical protein|nr:MAG: hypothetical protein CVV56_07570 [Tenericutes bacterium HGW-Tenericutes-1]